MKTPEEAAQFLNEFSGRRHAITQRIVAAARPLTDILKDFGCAHSAAPLEQLYFELDALEQEAKEAADQNPEVVLALLMRSVKK
jgi:hypothetical protein